MTNTETTSMDARLKRFLSSCSGDEVEELRRHWLERSRKQLTAEHRERFAEDVEDRLTWLRLAEPAKGYKKPSFFNQVYEMRHIVEPCDLPEDEERRKRVRALAETGMWSCDELQFPDIRPTDIGHVGLHQSTICHGEPMGVTYFLQSVWQVDTKRFSARGSAYAPFQWIVVDSVIDDKGVMHWAGAERIGWSEVTSYVSLSGASRSTSAKRRKIARDIIVQTLNQLLERRYSWRVEMGYPGHPFVSFECDPTGIRQLYADRDLGSRRRRAALRHWVSSHWRQARSQDEDDRDRTWVREHLRGATEFAWNGLACRVVPSVFDQERVVLSKVKVEATKLVKDGKIAFAGFDQDEVLNMMDTTLSACLEHKLRRRVRA
jgi:hypothetical protein